MGDSSDNIPGVPGVGPKTALKLICEYGTVEKVLENIAQISGKSLKEKLENNKDLRCFQKSWQPFLQKFQSILILII